MAGAFPERLFWESRESTRNSPSALKKKIYDPSSFGNRHRSVYLCLDTPESSIGSFNKLFKRFLLATVTERPDNLQAPRRTLVEGAILMKPSLLARCLW